jgi:hypothetical protein
MGSLFDYINWLAVLIGAVAYFALGALWYSFLFKNKWIAYNNIDMNDPNVKKGVGVTMFGSFVLMFVQSLALANFSQQDGFERLLDEWCKTGCNNRRLLLRMQYRHQLPVREKAHGFVDY